jgi:SSS family solute:Na+ symporter
MKLANIDIAIITLYFFGIIFLGFLAKKKTENNEEGFLLAGRKLTLPFFVASLVATWYGNILGIGEFVYSSGIVAWICFGVPYYVSGILFAFFFAKKARILGFRSIPEQIENKLGKKAGFYSSIIILIITLPAAYVLMLGVLFQLFSGFSLNISIIFVSILSLIFLFWGGFKADIWTNSAQFILMYLGFFVIVVFSILKLGDISLLPSKLPNEHLTPFGNRSIQYVLTWFIISLQTFIDPSFHQRCAATEKSSTAKKGVLISVLLWLLFDLMTILAGLYAKAYLQISDPLQAYPLLAELVLPAFWKGIFIIALLSVIMSTLDSYAFISAVTIGNDILSRFKRISKKSVIWATKLGLIITSILSILIAILIPSAIDIIFKTSSIALPGLLFPVIISYSVKWTIRKKIILPLIIIPSIISLLITLEREYNLLHLNFFQEIEPMFAGILISLFFGIFVIKREKI